MTFVKMFLYGPTGHGKTKFTADAPSPKWYDFENSTETLEHYPEYKDIPVVKFPKADDIGRLVKKDVQDPTVETVVIDTVTSGLDFYLDTYMKEVARGRNGRKPRDEFEISEGDYKYATNVFGGLFGELVRAEINIVVIGHERLIFDKDTGSLVRILPGLTPKLQEVATQLFNVVGYYKMKTSTDPTKRERELYVNPTGLIEAKNRLNIQETILKNPTWKDLYN